MVGGLTLTAANLLIPTALAATLAPIVSFAVFAGFVWKGLKADRATEKRFELRRQILPKINHSISKINDQTNICFSKFNQNLLFTLQVSIKESEDKIKALQTSIVEGKKSEQKSKAMIVELEQKVKFCKTLTTQLNLLYSNPFTNAK